MVPVATMFAVESVFEIRAFPWTERREAGELEPIPTLFQKVARPVTVAVDDARRASCTLKAPFTVDDAETM
jgi:hypothetical protein